MSNGSGERSGRTTRRRWIVAGVVCGMVPVVAATGPAHADAADLVITEVHPTGSSSPLGADWFEVTNTGTTTVDLTGWSFDDGSNAFATAVPLVGVSAIEPGQSVIFAEGADPAASRTAFETAWFAAGAPQGFTLGTYTGSGVGLSSGGDAVNLFDATGAHVTGVTFGAASDGITFDNAAGAAAVTTLSVVGTNGAFISPDGETGSPGTTTTTPPPPVGTSVVDLSTYVLTGRYDLPEPTRTTPPTDSLLAQEVSGVTYDAETDSLFVIGDGSTSIVQITKTGELIDSMTLAQGGSPQGTEFYDTEGITAIGGGQFIIVEERDRQVALVTYVPGTTITRADVQTIDLGTFRDNTGIEGLSFDPLTGGVVAVKEISPLGLFQTDLDFAAGTASNGSATTEDSVDLFDPTLLGLSDFADVYAVSNIPTLAGQPGEENLLVIGQEDGRIVETDRDGNVLSTLTITSDPGNPLSVPNQQHEGVTMDHDGNLYVVSENGGGSIDQPQLWVYAPSTVPNEAPTAVALTPSSTSVIENTSTATRLKVADVVLTDDGIGVNDFAVTGPDAASFEVDSNGLYVRTGVVLDFETTPELRVTVTVDDTSVGATPDATSDEFVLQLEDVIDETTVLPSVIVSEVSPWSSGNSSYGADWIELTNTGRDPISLAGWSIDDNSNTFANAVALTGVPSLAPGRSAIFLEGDAGTVAGFTSAWFGATPPAGLAIGTYSGGGIGLSTGGDAVNVFDAAGNRVTGVAFGVSTTGATFDNTVGLGSTELPLPTIDTLSAEDVNGAFLAADSEGVGSPGSIAPTLFVSEVSPWSSGDSPYGADWFEVTNTSANPVDITGWEMDDSSESPNGAVALLGVTEIAAGESVLFIEGDAADAEALVATWFGDAAPAGLQVGTYGGSGVGLSTGGDAVNLFDAAGRKVTGVSFGAATTGSTFDNRAATTSVSALSTLGEGGAFAAVGAAEVGSPGRIANAAPTAVELVDATTSLLEGTDTTGGVDVATIVVADDAPDPLEIVLTGADAAAFEVEGRTLRLRSGVELDFEAQSSLAVTVEVTDPTAPPTLSVDLEIAVTDVNEAPVASDDGGYPTSSSTVLRIPIAALLANDTDPDVGATLAIDPSGFSAVVGGRVSVDGADVVFTPTSGSSGAASFVYTVTDGELTDTATVTIEVTRPTIREVVTAVVTKIIRFLSWIFGR